MTIGIVGGGAIGGYLAVVLSAGGVPVIIYDRRQLSVPRVAGGPTRQAPILATTDASALRAASTIIFAVKSSATHAAAVAVEAAISRAEVVVAFQNGIDNVRALKSVLGDRVRGGVVTFHVIAHGDYRRKASVGKLIVGGPETPAITELSHALQRGGERVEIADDMTPVIYGKLLLNLNNGICAATGLGIRDVLASRDCRWALAQCVSEGLSVMRRAGIAPARLSVLPPGALARALTLPDVIVARAAVAFTRMDHDARSSTLDDLDRGRRTEIDALNGAIVTIADQHRIDAPINRLVTGIVHEHEARAVTGEQPRYLAPDVLRRRIEDALSSEAAA